jgi:hypothetical protein
LVESGDYHAGAPALKIFAPSLHLDIPSLIARLASLRAETPLPVPCIESPPEIRQRRHFETRAAPPARAPSLVA